MNNHKIYLLRKNPFFKNNMNLTKISNKMINMYLYLINPHNNLRMLIMAKISFFKVIK